MGKTTGYHPISLNVIRGACDYCGWKLGKIKRIAEMPEQQKAVYHVEILHAPRGSDDWPPKAYRRQLQHCFTDDIIVTSVLLSTSGQNRAVITVQLNRSPMDQILEGEQ